MTYYYDKKAIAFTDTKRRSLIYKSAHPTRTERTKFVEQVPLMEVEIDNEHLTKCVMSKAADGTDQTFVDIKSWCHLKSLYPDVASNRL